jgi:hypothetical protein
MKHDDNDNTAYVYLLLIFAVGMALCAFVLAWVLA